MKRRVASGIMLTFLLIAMLALAFNIQPVKASGTIYIRADGSVDPPTAPIQRNGDVYTFTANIYDGIVVQRSNIIIDGNGYTLQGWGDGFTLAGINNTTIKNTNINRFYTGIKLDSSSKNSISGNNITNNWGYGILLQYSSNFNSISANNITNNWEGILLDESSNNSISRNNITNHTDYGIFLVRSSNNDISGNRITANNQGGIYCGASNFNSMVGNVFVNDGLFVWESYGNVVDANVVNGKPLIYLEGASDYIVENAGQVILINCRDIRVENLDLSNTDVGVELLGTNNTRIFGNNITANNRDGITLDSSSNNNISRNNITANNNAGIVLWYSSNFNSISVNNITNSWDGIGLYRSLNNRIFHNNFINNAQQVVCADSSFGNVWDDGYPSGGNYWSDYNGTDFYSGPYQSETGSDGMGDMPYIIDGNNNDRYPLIHPYGYVPSPDLNGDGKVDIKDIAQAALAFGSYPSHPRWNPSADINQDGRVYIKDLAIIAKNFGKKYP